MRAFVLADQVVNGAGWIVESMSGGLGPKKPCKGTDKAYKNKDGDRFRLHSFSILFFLDLTLLRNTPVLRLSIFRVRKDIALVLDDLHSLRVQMAIVSLIFHPLPEICFELLNPLGMLWFSGQVVEFIGINGEIVELMLGPGPNAIDHRLGMRIRLHAINHGGIDQAKIGLSGFTGQITGGDIHTVKIMGSEVPNEFVLSIRHRTDTEVGIRLI